MNINELIKIDRRFQKSINLKYDLKDVNKIKHYIPTTSSLAVLESYVNDLLNSDSYKSTVLVGPYGKGKSQMLLMLISLISYYDNEEVIDELLVKVEKEHKEIANTFKKIRRDKVKYLPLIISNTQNDFNQSILLSLMESLKREGITNLTPDTNYSEAVKKIELWETDYPDVYKKLINNVDDIVLFKKKLNNFEKDIYDDFLELHKNLTAGSEFNPLINMEVTDLLESVNRELVDNYSYNGMILVFDEFSKYLESSNNDSVTNEIKIIQDICELCNSSKDAKMFSIFVMHKRIREYGREISDKVKNAFDGIIGRIEEKEFYTSSKNNYELLGDVLLKTKKYDAFKKSNHLCSNLLATTKEIEAFNTVFEKDEIETIVMDNCYPLTPVTAYLLQKISEKIGQNERSIFTFLSSGEENGLLDILDRDFGLECVDSEYIYDYFTSTIQANRNEIYMYQINLNLNSALKSAENGEQIKLLKSLALIHMINDFDSVPTNSIVLSNATGYSITKVESIINELKQKGIIGLRRNKLMFKTAISVSLEESINNTIAEKMFNISSSSILREIENHHYMISRNYNNKYKMTRYFEKIYMSVSEYNALPNFEILFEENFSDGKIIYLIGTDEDYKSIKELPYKNIIIIKMRQDDKLDALVKKYMAIKDLILNTSDEVIISELNAMRIEVREDIIKIRNKAIYSNKKYKEIIVESHIKRNVTERKMDLLISNILENEFPSTVVVNYELINKQVVTGAYKKARQTVINAILDHDKSSYVNGTSAESSLYRATIINTGIENSKINISSELEKVLKEINDFLLSNPDRKTTFKHIYDVLQGNPYGMRKGIIPIYLAYVISNIDADITYYLENKEIELSYNTFDLINEEPDKISFLIEKKSSEREVYLHELEAIFEDYSMRWKDKVSRHKQITFAMQTWFNSLPNITRNVNSFDVNGIEYNFMALRKLINRPDINSRDMLFDELPSLYNSDLEVVINTIRIMKKYLDGRIDYLRFEIENCVKTSFKINEKNSLGTFLKMWFESYESKTEIITLSSKTNSFVNLLKNVGGLTTNQIVEKTSMIFTGLYPEDWNNNTINIYQDSLNQSKLEIENIDDNAYNGEFRVIIKKGDNIELEKIYSAKQDGTAEFMTNELDDILDQYGDSIDTETKIAILASLIQKVSKR